MTALTRVEIDQMKHALGWPKDYRNHYAAGGDDVAVWDGLVAKGFAVKHRQSVIFPDPIYSVTKEARTALAQANRIEQP